MNICMGKIPMAFWKLCALPAGVLAIALLAGCGSSSQFVAVPSTLDTTAVPRVTLEMTAEHYHFTPDLIRVKAGTLVTLKVTSIDGTHGFKLGAFGIDERLDEHQTKVIRFFASQKGEYGFSCSHFCGIGHFGMNGKVIVE